MADINLDLGIDDTELINALNKTERQLKDVEKAADKTGDELSRSMRKAEKDTEQLNRELKKTDTELKKAGKSATNVGGGLSNSLRSFRRNTSAVFTAVAGGAIAAGAAIQQFAQTFDPLVGIQKATAEAAEDAIGSFIEERQQLNQLTAAATDNTRSEKERALAKEALINQYEDYLPSIREDLKTTDLLTLANGRLKDAIIERTATQATEAIKAKLLADIGTKLLEERQQQFAALTQTGANSTIGAIRLIQASAAGAQGDALKTQLKFLDLAKEDIKAVLAELDSDILGVGATTKLTEKELTDLAGKTTKAAKETKEEYKLLDGSLADLQKRLSDINKLITEQTAAGDVTALTPLVEDAKELQTQIDAAKKLIEDLRTPPTEDLDIPFIKSINATVKSLDDLKAESDVAISELETTQAVALATLKLRGATEKELTDLQATQEKERQRLALETEKKKLEYTIQFGEQRTAAESAILAAQIETIKAQLSAFDTEAQAVAADPTRKKGFLGLFGIDPDSEEGKALQKGFQIATENIQQLFQKQLEAATANVELRDKNVKDLENRLDQELKLNEQGFASNVALTQQQLAEERKAREKALADQKKTQVIQEVLDTAIQAGNLATASTEIFSSFAALPFGIGIPIAAGVIAAMIGSFIALKAKAFSAASQSFAGGGELPSLLNGGRSDRYGGRGHRIEDTNIRVGGGEFITNAEDTAEQRPLLKAINDGKFRGVDLMGIVENRKRRTAKTQKRADSIVIRSNNNDSAIKEQTQTIVKFLTAIVDKPVVTTTADGWLEIYTDINGNKLTKKINKK